MDDFTTRVSLDKVVRENGLTVLEEICPLSARVVVNPVSMKMENERISDILRRINEVL